jgi:hypothetical protein
VEDVSAGAMLVPSQDSESLLCRAQTESSICELTVHDVWPFESATTRSDRGMLIENRHNH